MALTSSKGLYSVTELFYKLLLGPYNTRDYPITIVVVSLINIVVPLLSPYVIIAPHRIPLLLFLWLYIIIVRLARLYSDSLAPIYRKEVLSSEASKNFSFV